jgi:putative PIN family toxin of toxin-antitoxin system
VIPVVIDTGVFAAGVFWRNEPHQCVKAWLRGLVSLVISEAIYREYDRILRKLQVAHGFNANLDRWLGLVRNYGLWVAPYPLAETVCRDPKDDIMIEAALAAGARTIIARDADLIVLEKPFGIRIVTPRAWLATLSRADRRKLA